MIDLLHKQLFLVDDDELILKSFSRHLKNLGFENIKTFDNGGSALNQLTENPFLVLLDYQMADLNGFEVLRKIKRYNPNTYVIMLSSQDDLQSAVNTLKFGAFDYIIKGDADMQNLQKALERIAKLDARILAPRKSLFSKVFSLV